MVQLATVLLGAEAAVPAAALGSEAGDAAGRGPWGRKFPKFPKIAPFELEISPSESFFRTGSHGDVRLGRNPQERPFLAGRQNSNNSCNK